MDIDLESGGGGGGNNGAVAVLRCPDPADPHMKERQPLTWLRAAPYIAATLAGAALLGVSTVLMMSGRRSCTVRAAGHQDMPTNATGCDWAIALAVIGVLAIAIPCWLLAALMDSDYEDCCRPRLEADR